MPLKIGFLTERLLLGFGVDLTVHKYALFLSGHGCDVEVYCMRHDRLVDRDYAVVDLLTPGTVTFTADITQNAMNFADYFNSRGVDIWIVNTPPFYDVVPLLRRPAIVIEYGTPPSRFFEQAIGRNLDASVTHRFRQVFPKLRPYDKILCISRAIQNWLPVGARRSSEVSYLGCDHYTTASSDAIEAFRREMKIEAGITILWVGRVQVLNDEQPYKGFAEFIELVERARAADPNLRFVVVGRGGAAEEDFLRSRHIVPCLNLPHERMGAAFASSDLFINTSLWEGFNLPLLEAQYQGTPVLAYRHGPHTEVVADGETGVLVDDREEMLAALLALSRDSDRRKRLGVRALEFAADFSWERSARRLEQACKQALALATASSRKDRPAIDVSGLGARLFAVTDAYHRFGFAFTLKRIALLARASLLRAIGR